MNDPLAELKEWWSRAYDDGGMGTQCTEYIDRGDHCELILETWDDKEAQATWKIEIQGCEARRWLGDWGEPQWFANHFLTGSASRTSWISFSQPFDRPDHALGAVLRVHHEVAGDWIPLSQFFRIEMLNHRFGELARGPKELLAAYERVLLDLGGDVAMVSHPEEDLAGHREIPTSLLRWGKSYFVAQNFKLTRLS